MNLDVDVLWMDELEERTKIPEDFVLIDNTLDLSSIPALGISNGRFFPSKIDKTTINRPAAFDSDKFALDTMDPVDLELPLLPAYADPEEFVERRTDITGLSREEIKDIGFRFPKVPQKDEYTLRGMPGKKSDVLDSEEAIPVFSTAPKHPTIEIDVVDPEYFVTIEPPQEADEMPVPRKIPLVEEASSEIEAIHAPCRASFADQVSTFDIPVDQVEGKRVGNERVLNLFTEEQQAKLREEGLPNNRSLDKEEGAGALAAIKRVFLRGR